MSSPRRKKYARLLRWYPQRWRAEHGRFMLDTLDEYASDQGIMRPSLAEAWSIRSHGMGERASYRWAVVFAALSLVAFLGAAVILLSNTLLVPEVGVVRTLLAVLVGPLTLAVAAIVILHRRGTLSAPAALCAAMGTVPTFTFTALAAMSVALGFDEADAGTARTWFASAGLLLILLTWCTGALTLLVPLLSVLKNKLPRTLRWVVASLMAAFLSLILAGLVMTSGQIFGSLPAAALLLLAIIKAQRSQQGVQPGKLPGARLSQPPYPVKVPYPVKAPSYSAGTKSGFNNTGFIKISAVALFSLVLGMTCAAFALTGSNWGAGVGDASRAMNLGLAAGALATLPVVVLSAVMLLPRFGAVMWFSAGLACVALLVVAVAQLLGAGHSLQWPLILAAAVMVGFALAVPLGRWISGSLTLRVAALGGLGLACSLLGIYLVTAAAFVAPWGAAVLLFYSLRRLAHRKSRVGPHLVSQH